MPSGERYSTPRPNIETNDQRRFGEITSVSSCVRSDAIPASSSATWSPFISGAVSGIAVAVVGHPFDTVKVRMQTATQVERTGLFGANVPNGTHVISATSLRGLCRGILPQIGLQLVASGTLFGAQHSIYQQISSVRSFVDERGHARGSRESLIHENVLLHSISGAGAGVLLSILTCPLEVAKCRLQALPLSTHPTSALKLASYAARMMQTSGVSVLYRGFGPQVLRCSLGNFAYFGTFEACKVAAQRDLTTDETMTAGALAGCMFWTVSYPFDIIKSQQQTCQASTSTSRSSSCIPSMSQLLVQNYRTHGAVRGLYRGLSVTLLRAIPTNAAAWITYRTLSNWFGTEASTSLNHQPGTNSHSRGASAGAESILQ